MLFAKEKSQVIPQRHDVDDDEDDDEDSSLEEEAPKTSKNAARKRERGRPRKKPAEVNPQREVIWKPLELGSETGLFFLML